MKIKFKKLNKNMEELEDLILEWYLDSNDIHCMESLNIELREYMPEELLRMVEYNIFSLEDDYFFINAYGSLESITREDIIVEIETLNEEEIEELEDYLIERVGA